MSVITAADIEKARDVLVVANGDVITPLARDRAKELGVRLERSPRAAAPTGAGATNGKPANSYGSSRAAPSALRSGFVAAAALHGDSVAATPAFRSASATVPPRPPQRLRNDIPPRGPQREHISGLPSVVPPAPPPNGIRPPEKSGALYRRGGYGLDGRRDLVNEFAYAPAAHTRPTVAVIGAGHVGAATGIRLAESNLFERLTLVDVVDGLAAGLALDMWHSAGLQRFTTRVAGSARLDDVAGADIVVITAGRPRKPGMSRTDLTAANAEIVGEIAAVVREHAPGAVVVVVTNPLEEMTHLTAKITGFPPERVIGMGGVLDTARFRALVGLTGIAKPEDVRAIVLGSHGSEMVIPLSQASANGALLETRIDEKTLADIVQRTRESGAEVTGLLRVGSAHVSPGSAIARQVEAIVHGSDEVVPACVASNGAYGIRDVRVGLPVRLGLQGVREIVELPLRPAELRALRDAAEQIRARTQALG